MLTYQHGYGRPYTISIYIMPKVKAMADILIPLHEPRFASQKTIA